MPRPSRDSRHKKVPVPQHKKARLEDSHSSKPYKKALSQSKISKAPTASSSKAKERPREATPVPSKGKGKEKEVATSTPQNVVLPSSFKVIAGTYEKLLYGLEGTVDVEDSELKFNLKPIFIFPAHISCIKAVAASPNGGKWLATGSADEVVKVWDLRRRKEIGGLMHHEGSITYLGFPSRSHLLSASEDGTLCLFHARDWNVLRSLKGHKGRVNCVAIHPSGKLALSVGQDRTLRMWDLMRGKGCASTKLGKEGELVRWSTDGTMFVVQLQSTIDLYSMDMTLLHTLIHPSRLQDIKFCKPVDGEGELLLAAAEDKKLSIYEIPPEKERPPTIIAEMVGHTNRVKAVDTLKISLPVSPSSSRASTTIVSTISSDGKIHIYDLASVPKGLTPNDEKVQIQPSAFYDTKGSRLTCLTLADGDFVDAPVTQLKRKREANDQESDDDDDDERESQQESEQSSDGEKGMGSEEEDEEESEIEAEEEAESE